MIHYEGDCLRTLLIEMPQVSPQHSAFPVCFFGRVPGDSEFDIFNTAADRALFALER